jgi:effector-binding domain-containing protein
MLEQPRIVRTDAKRAAIIRLSVPREEIKNVMGPAIGEVIAAVSAQGVGPAGPVFAHHLRMSPALFEFEVGVPVRAAVEPTGRVEPGELPAAKVARAVYRGPYEGLYGAWTEFDGWMKAEGLKPASDLWECYVAGPESSSDPSTWRTELNRPLAS